MNNVFSKYCIFTCISLLAVGCSGFKTFNDSARAGDTVALAAGWKSNFLKSNITVVITPSIGADIVIPPNDPAIRAVINMYPDPVSNAVVSREINIDQTIHAQLYGNLINGITGNDLDWYQTTVLLDLPPGLPVGTANILITNTDNETAMSTVEVIPGTGNPHQFTADSATSVNSQMFLSMQRATSYTVKFDNDGSPPPHAIEINFLHDPDVDNSGTGKAIAINPLGYKKNLMWSDDGVSMKVILVSSNEIPILNMSDYKFYVAGKIQNLIIDTIQAFDINGNIISNVAANISQPGP